MTLNCLANDWKKDKYRYSLELSKSKTPQNTILVVGVNPGGQTDPEEQYFGSTIRRVCKLVFYKMLSATQRTYAHRCQTGLKNLRSKA